MSVEQGIPFKATLDQICRDHSRGLGGTILYGRFTKLTEDYLSQAEFPLPKSHGFTEGEVLLITPTITSYPSGGSLTQYHVQRLPEESTI